MKPPPGKLSLAEFLPLSGVSTGIHRQDKSLFAPLLEVEGRLHKAVRGDARATPGKHKMSVVQDFNQSLRRSLPRYIE
jgi:hypothetical protein